MVSFSFKIHRGRSVTAPITRLTTASISGSTAVGQTLTCTVGTYTGPATPITVTHQWYSNGSPIAGQLGTTYVTTSGVIGTSITCVEIATDANNVTLSTTTNTIGPIIAGSINTNSAIVAAVLANDL